MDNKQLSALREQLLAALAGEQSHIAFDAVVSDFPEPLIARKPVGVPHSAWQLLEHLRIAQHDILEFSRNPKHQSPQWPEGYWPTTDAPVDSSSWKSSIASFQSDAKALKQLIQDPSHNLFAPIEGGDGQTLLREALVVSAHNSYHLGQLEFLKKMLLARHAD